jgi:hypothetical protein
MSEELERYNNIFGCWRSSTVPTASVVLAEPDLLDIIFGWLMRLRVLEASHDTGGT